MRTRSPELSAATHRTGRSPAGPAGLVGPNAIIQLQAALAEHVGRGAAHAVMTAAGLAHYRDAPPTALVPEAEPARLFAALRRHHAPAEADAILTHAGRLTADYILAHRIPAPAQRMLRALPPPLAVRALLAAIHAHAWTFAGSGHVNISLGRRPALTIASNPLTTPGCPWHVGVLERLMRACGAPSAVVRHRSDRDTDCFDVTARSHAF